MNKTITAGKWELCVEQYGSRFVVRLANGMALTLGATKKCCAELVQRITDGQMDSYINDHCKGGQ